jgi:hypothetical protein
MHQCVHAWDLHENAGRFTGSWHGLQVHQQEKAETHRVSGMVMVCSPTAHMLHAAICALGHTRQPMFSCSCLHELGFHGLTNATHYLSDESEDAFRLHVVLIMKASIVTRGATWSAMPSASIMAWQLMQLTQPYDDVLSDQAR